jgi:hypothetical protein
MCGRGEPIAIMGASFLSGTWGRKVISWGSIRKESDNYRCNSFFSQDSALREKSEEG